MVDDASGECRVDEDKVLIECWMGAKWGFYKFPVDPDTDRPVIGEQLSWREQHKPVPELDGPQSPYLDGRPEHIAIGFDLDLPLRDQLEKAKRLLQGRQARLRREAVIRMQTVANCSTRWCFMLRLLDGLCVGEHLDTVISALKAQGLDDTLDPLELLGEAKALVDRKYRDIALLPD